MPTRTTRKGVTAAKRASKPKAPTKAQASKPQVPAPPHDPALPLENSQHERFCCEYAKDSNGAQAYMRTYGGDNAASARAAAARLLAVGSVRDRADLLLSEVLAALRTEPAKVLQGMARIAFNDIRSAFDSKGNLLPVHELPDAIAMSIAGIEVFEEYEGKGADRTFIGYTKKIKFNDRRAALADLGKHFKLFTEKVELTGKDGGPVQTIQQEPPEAKAARTAFEKRLAAVESAVSQ